MYPPKGNQYLPDQSSIPPYPPTGNQYYPPVQPSAPPHPPPTGNQYYASEQSSAQEYAPTGSQFYAPPPPPTGNQYHAPEQSSAQEYPPTGSQFYPPKQLSAPTYPTPTDQYYPSEQPPAPPPATGIPVHPTGQFYPTAAPGVQVTSTVQFYPTAAPPGQFYAPAGQAGFQTQPRGHAGWSTGLFDCFDDVGNSIITLFLPCVTFGQIAEILDRGSNSCVTSTVLYTLILYFFGCPCVYSCTYRSKLRAQYSLEESPCNDCIVHCCLEQCALCQEYRELKNRGFDMNIGYRANMERQGHGAIVQPPIQVGMYR